MPTIERPRARTRNVRSRPTLTEQRMRERQAKRDAQRAAYEAGARKLTFSHYAKGKNKEGRTVVVAVFKDGNSRLRGKVLTREEVHVLRVKSRKLKSGKGTLTSKATQHALAYVVTNPAEAQTILGMGIKALHVLSNF
mgnify:CR=1 FL=1